jgi:hypothetical protein
VEALGPDLAAGRLQAIRLVVNPDGLAHLAPR